MACRDGPPYPSHLCFLRPLPTERDVSRTDRTNKFYEGPENPGLGLLNDILLTYCMYHFDLGGCQAWGQAGPGLSRGALWAWLQPDSVSPQATSRA